MTMTSKDLARSWRSCALAAFAAVTLAGCSEEGPRAITMKRIAPTASPPVIEGVTEAQRFRWRPSAAEAERAQQQRPEAPPAPMFSFGLPDGWERLPETQFRQINTQVAGHPEAQCYLSWLPMDGGGDVANVNRWRTQLGLGPLDADAVAQLPRGTLLGAPAIRIDLAGSFTGMLGERVDEARLLGMLLTRREGGALFVKFVGPAAVIGANEDEFDSFVESIRLADEAPTAGGVSALDWTVPGGWQQEPGSRAMREVTLTRGESEMYVTVLGGGGGGVLANVNRWLGQLGSAPIGVAELGGLERVESLGTSGYVVEAEGTLSAMGGPAREGMGLLGLVVERPGELVTVKLVGPADEVSAARPAFIAFVGSLRDRP